MKRIAVVTATRAEYGLLSPLIKRIMNDDELEPVLIVTGGHLSAKQGDTVSEIREDHIPIAHEIAILDEDNSSVGISVTMANALRGFAACFHEDRPDMAVIMGDRTEILAVAAAAMNERIPLVHIGGGEITEGAVDDCVRHALSKMSYLHFVSTEDYRRRVIQMGEAPERVYNVGALSTENILTQELVSEEEFRTFAGIPETMKYVVVTFHPVTLEDATVDVQIKELTDAMRARTDLFYVITGANADAGGDRANELLEAFAGGSRNAFFTQSLGMKRYLSAVKYAAFVLGNSSSGLIEAPVLGTPTVNIGDRQRGRLLADTVINAEPYADRIAKAMDRALLLPHKPSYLYGDGHTSEKMVEIIKKTLHDHPDLKKGFYDL
ncbi:MAG: UDP-N-acetylglucosamine 2-epimerase (hydrolyzing) [Lachnospiraceae bacterium]|nr:UDP-N-acetylglucosamine 2-epimerase (hydrolyzing) [Lachnospiraceae bacterium]